jgi:hypothetical protein
MNPVKEELARLINPQAKKGGLKEALTGADVFIGFVQTYWPCQISLIMAMNPSYLL